MKNSLSFLVIAVMMLVVACTTNAVTGRKQLSLVPEEQLQQMAVTEYRTFLSQKTWCSPVNSLDAEM